MKKSILTALMFAMFTLAYSQEVKIAANPYYYGYATEQLAVGKGKLTIQYVVVKGVKHTLYQGSKGGLYYIVKDAKTGNFERKYIKVN